MSDFTTEIYTPAHASGFYIRGNEKDASTLVTIRNPWQGGSQIEQHLLILRDEGEDAAFAYVRGLLREEKERK